MNEPTPEPDLTAQPESFEMELRGRVTILEHHLRIAIALAMLAELGVIALAILFALNRRRTNA